MCAALTAVCKLLSLDLISAVLDPIIELLKHPKELVRKKAVMALHRFEQLDPLHEGPLHNTDIYSHIKDCLCDKVTVGSLLSKPALEASLVLERAQRPHNSTATGSDSQLRLSA